MKLTLLLLGNLAWMMSSASAVLLNFDTAAQFTENFEPEVSYAWSSSSGIGGVAGRVNSTGDAGAGNASRTYYDTTFNWNTEGDDLYFSVFFLGQAATSSSLLRQGIGLATTTTTNFLTGGTGAVAWRLIKSGSSNFSFDFKYGSGGSDATIISTSNFNLITGNWYKIDVKLSRLETLNTFSYDVALENWGANGTSLAGTLASANNAGFTNAALYSSTAVNAGVAAANIAGGFTAFDNFHFDTVPVPEPQSALLILLGIVPFTVVWLRNCRKVTEALK